MIHQCFNLCPEYSVDANEQSRIATGICAAVPTPSPLPVPSGSPVPSPAPVTSAAPSGTTSAAPSSSQSVSASFGTRLNPISYMAAFAFVLAAVFTQL